jgi:hypothetical protein
MEVCKSCGAFLMEGWERCRICGHDPAAPAPTPEAEAHGGKGRGKRTKSREPKEPKPPRGPKEPTTVGTVAMFVVLVAAMVGAGYLFWYQPQQEEEAEQSAARAAAALGTTPTDPASDTSVPVDPTAAPGDTSTSAPPVTTPDAVVTTVRPATTPLSGEAPGRQQYAIAIGTIGRNNYPNTSADAWTCAGGLTIDALGGPDAVFAQGVAPADFEAADVADSRLDQRLVIPNGALDLVASGLRGCGIDGEELFIASLSTDTPEQRACIVAGLDGTLANQAIAGQLMGGPEALAPGTAFYDHLLAVALGCGQGGP